MVRLWRVVGGKESGGILVRQGSSTSSPQEALRLGFGAVVRELELNGERLHYERVSGEGPSTGWVSTKLKGKPLLEESEDDASEGTYIDVEFSGDSLRNVKHGLAYLERLVEITGKVARPGNEAEESLKNVVDDLLYCAKDRDSRNRIIEFLGKFLQRAVKEHWESATNLICWRLCLVSWASSLQDILYFPPREDKRLIVLLFGFGGSHMNDLRPAAVRWSTHSGAAVLAVGPVKMARADVLATVYKKFKELLSSEHSLVIHWCSDGGFEMAREFLLLHWLQDMRNDPETVAPNGVLKCIISDSAGLGAHGIVKDGAIMDGQEAVLQDSKKLQQLVEDSALFFFAGCGINMFMQCGACTAFHEEPANSFAAALTFCCNNGVIWSESQKLTNTLWTEAAVQDIFKDVPILVITSKADKVVTLDRSIFLADCFRKLQDRRANIAHRWRDATKDIVAEDGSGVHELIFEKVDHCKGFVSKSEEYWTSVDKLVNASLFAGNTVT